MNIGNWMRHHTIRTRSVFALAAAASGAALMLAAAGSANAQDVPLTTENPRPNSAPLTGGDAAYEYAPTIIAENGVYRMWYCAQDPQGAVPGDDILYAESANLNGPFTAPGGGDPLIVFEGRGDGSFDGQHTCDPSIVKVDGTYYMYYGAAVNDGATTIGVARSADGFTWERMVSAPIIAPAGQQDTGNDYGAGQPSAVYLDGQFYLIFTDTTGAGALASNGAGQFAWRSSDPTFATGTEVFTAEGWQASTPENNRRFSVANAFSADWQYSDEIESFIIAHNNDAGRTTLTFLGTENLAEHPYAPVNIEGAWAEGPGVVSLPDKHAVDDGPMECGRVPVDVIHSSRADGVPPQDLVHKGIDLVAPIDCEEPSPTPTPTEDPTDEPTEDPTDEPTDEPTEEPTDEPSESPTPTQEPTEDPTPSPSPTSDDDLPDTGASSTGLLVTLGVALMAGAALLYRYRRGTIA